MSVGEFWPEKAVQANTWTLNHRQNAPVSLSGDSVVTDFGEPYWTVEVSVEVPIRSELEREWSSFFRRRKGQKNTFTMNRSFRSFPERGGFNPSAEVSILSTNRAGSVIRVNGHGSGRLTAGDMFSYFTASQGYFVGEIETVIQNDGAALEFEVSQPPFTPHPSTPAPRFVKSVGEFRMDGPASVSETHVSRTFNFTATQVIRG